MNENPNEHQPYEIARFALGEGAALIVYRNPSNLRTTAHLITPSLTLTANPIATTDDKEGIYAMQVWATQIINFAARHKSYQEACAMQPHIIGATVADLVRAACEAEGQ